MFGNIMNLIFAIFNKMTAWRIQQVRNELIRRGFEFDKDGNLIGNKFNHTHVS